MHHKSDYLIRSITAEFITVQDKACQCYSHLSMREVKTLICYSQISSPNPLVIPYKHEYAVPMGRKKSKMMHKSNAETLKIIERHFNSSGIR